MLCRAAVFGGVWWSEHCRGRQEARVLSPLDRKSPRHLESKGLDQVISRAFL